MKIYIVLDAWDTHFGGGTNKDKAQAYIKEQLDETIINWTFSSDKESDEHYFCITDGSATICDYCDVKNWVMFEKEIEV